MKPPLVLIGALVVFVLIVSALAFTGVFSLDSPEFFRYTLIGTIAISGTYVLYFLYRVKSGLARLLQQPSLDPFDAFYDEAIGNVPDSHYFITGSKGVIAALYGEFDLAGQAYNMHVWSKGSAAVQAQGEQIRILIDYLHTKNYYAGHQRAIRSQQTSTVSKLLPGAQIGNSALSSQVLIGEILQGNATDEVMTTLQADYRKLPLLGKLIAAWGLAKGHTLRGEIDKAQAYLAFIEKSAPHCKGLLNS
jgi:hypothetical protein